MGNVNSTGSSLTTVTSQKSAFNFKLSFIFLIIISLIISGCEDPEFVSNFINDCYTSTDPTGSLSSNPHVLCIKNPIGAPPDQNDFCCLDSNDFGICTQSELSSLSVGIASEVISVAYEGIQSEGNSEYEFSEDDEGSIYLFFENTLSMDDNGCTDNYLNEMMIRAEGPEHKNAISALDTVLFNGATDSIPLMLYCGDNDRSKFIFIQDSGEDDNGDVSEKKEVYVCYDGEWYKNEEISILDLDGDDAPDPFDVDDDGSPDNFLGLDCDPTDPSRHVDLSIFNGFDKPVQICGDGQDNICSDSNFYSYSKFAEYYDYVEPFVEGESDSCDNDPYACENNCLFEDNECDYLAALSSEDGSVSETGAGFCCGDNQVDDVGRIKNDPDTSGTNKLCAYIDEGENFMMGGANELSLTECSENEFASCSDEWRWIDPDINGFKVFSIKELGKEPFDVVSNSNNWKICNESTLNPNLPVPESGANLVSNKQHANRFTCYDQGDRYVWAECVPETQTEESSNTIKERRMGDAVYALPLDSSGTSITLFEFSSQGTYYAQATDIQNIDFTGYDYLEFFVRFNTESPTPPADVVVTIVGEGENEAGDDLIYFSGSVLGYAINAPLISPDHWIHVQVPIGEWINIKEIQFIASNPDVNNVEIQSPHLTRINEVSKICSGYETQDTSYNSWLDSIDFSQDEINIRGDKVCEARYGTAERNAWLGGNLEVEDTEFSCCGNAINEYYSGITTLEDVPRGCWNGKVVIEGQTAMNVEYSVEYQQTDYEVSFDSVNVGYELDYQGDKMYPGHERETFYVNPQTVGYDESPKVMWEFEFDLNTLDDEFVLDIIKDNPLDESLELYFFLPGTQIRRNSPFTINQEVAQSLHITPTFTLQIIAETQKYLSTPIELPPQTTIVSAPCLDEECIYGLPGNPPYEITNNHPELYDMYFITGNTAEEQTLITQENQQFNVPGNLRVEKISQQVIYTQNEEGTYEFLGCNAADYIATDVNIAIAANEGICTTTSSHYCAPQTNNNLINSWSDEPLTDFGYDVSGYQEGDELQKMGCDNLQNTDVDCSPSARNYSTSATPGRNILSNALFEEKVVNDITFWTLLDNTGHLTPNEASMVDNEIFEIPSNSILKSEKIAVLANEDYEFNQESDCDVTINVGNNAGLEEREESVTFTTQETESYVQIIIDGECDFTHPSLHLVDDLNVAETEYDQDNFLRTGVSCCPNTMCWNGYTCTQDMAEYTFMSEKIGEVDYRCITGEWTYMGPKKDWKDDQAGFCSNNEQCFVASSLLGALSTNTAADFYEGQYPTCVNNGEYIFDHLCQEGEWISRTTNIVDTFVEFADTKDYVLYCSNYKDVFVDYNEPAYNLELQIAGQPVAQTTAVPTDITGQPIEQPTNALCFPNIDDPEIGQRLVPDRDNTCINNVCVLKYKDGSDFKTTFATSMNLPLDSPDSFLNTLGLTTEDLASCTSAGVFSQCTNEVWYSPDIGALIYAKGGINLNPGFFSSIASWFVGLFTGSSASDVSEFLSNATNFNKLYVLNNNADNKQVRAISEPVNGEDVILAEYVGFETPVCEYVLKISEDKVLENRWPASPLYLVTCDGTSNDVYQVMAQTHPEFWWPQLTGSLRSFTE
jgi:hypothetical protein